MVKRNYNTKIISFILLVFILLLTSLFLSMSSYPLVTASAQEEINVVIKIKDDYELVYKAENYIEKVGQKNIPDEDLFDIFEFHDEQENIITDLPRQSVLITVANDVIKNVGNYQVEVFIDDINYIGQAELSIEVLAYEIAPTAESFLGFLPKKIYDTTTDIGIYEKVILVNEQTLPLFLDLIDWLTDDFELDFELIDALGISLLNFLPADSDYQIIRFSIEDSIEVFCLNGYDNTKARGRVLQIFNDIETFFDNQGYDYIAYNGDVIANLYYTEFGELIELNGLGYVQSEFVDKNVDYGGKGYIINFDGFNHSNYTFSCAETMGYNGTISHAVVGIINPLLYITYGDVITEFNVEIINKALLDTHFDNNIIKDGNELHLPYMVMGGSGFIRIVTILDGFYAEDLANPEILAILNGSFLNFDIAEEDLNNSKNVYIDIDNMDDGPYMHNLSLLSTVSNYGFIDILYEHGVSGYMERPCIIVNPKTVVIEEIGFATERNYNGTDKMPVQIIASTGILTEELDLFSMEINAYFSTHQGVRINSVSNNLQLSDFEIVIKPISGTEDFTYDELLLMCYNYTIDKVSILQLIEDNADIILQLLVTTSGQNEEWMSLTKYLNQYNDREILDFKITSSNPQIVRITQAELTISIEDAQELIYGNDILDDLIIVFENFYEESPSTIFSFDFLIKDSMGNIVTNPNNNSLPTELLPSSQNYTIQLLPNYNSQSSWQNQYGQNYNIIIDTTSVSLKILKGILDNVEIASLEKAFGEKDPDFFFNSIYDYRDSDLDNLVTLLYRVVSGENVTRYPISLGSHQYYEYINLEYGYLDIVALSIDFSPDPLEITYGTATGEIFELTGFTYYVETELFGRIDLNIAYICEAMSLDASNYYENNIFGVYVVDATYQNQIVFNVISGAELIKIVPLEIEIDLADKTEGRTAYRELAKDYDGTSLIIRLKNDYMFSYSYPNGHLYNPDNPDYPVAVEDREAVLNSDTFFSLNGLQYDEKLFFARIEGDINDSDYDRVSAGEKELTISNIVIVRNDMGSLIHCPSENYIFKIKESNKGEILPRPITFDPSDNGKNYTHIFDGNKFVIAFNESMVQNVLTGQYIIGSSVWFETEDENAELDAKILYLNAEDIVITDDIGIINYSENYRFVYNNDCFVMINPRGVNISISSDILQVYDGMRTALSFDNSQLYAVKDGIYTEKLDGAGLPLKKTFIFVNADNSEEQPFVYNHRISGKLISSTSFAGKTALIADGTLSIENSQTRNYRLIFENRIFINITKRNLSIDVNPIGDIPEIIYNGQPYSVELMNYMADNLIVWHLIAGYRETRDANVLRNIAGLASPKTIDTNVNFVILDDAIDVTNNYNIVYVQRYVQINPKDITIDINMDSSLSTTKEFDGTRFIVNLTDVMMNGMLEGEAITQGSISTVNENAYTIINDNIEFVPKALDIRPNDNAIIIRKTDNSQSQHNYDFIIGVNNVVTIYQKNVRLDITRYHGSQISAVYNGDYITYTIRNEMVINMDTDNNSGLVAEHYVSDLSNPLISAQIEVGTGIDILYSDGDAIIVDEFVTNNYIINYVPYKMSILKRELYFNIINDETIELVKVYDGEIFSVALSDIMDESFFEGSVTRGLVSGHHLLGIAYTIDATVGANKPLEYQIAIKDETELNDYTENYMILPVDSRIDIVHRQLAIDINVSHLDGQMKVYDGLDFKIAILEEMIMSELANGQWLVIDIDMSYIRTRDTDARDYNVANSEDVTYRTTIVDAEGGENLSTNYQVEFVNNTQVAILKRKITITARGSQGFYFDELDNKYVSGLNGVYNEKRFTVSYENYYIDLSDNDNDGFGYTLAAGHRFVSGQRQTQTFDVAEKILLVNHTAATIRDDSARPVTDNYVIEFQDSYFTILKRTIKFDVARNVSNYDEEKGFLHPYNNQIYEIQIDRDMVVFSAEDSGILESHQIKNGFLVTENAYVNRDVDGNVIPKPLIWDVQRALLIQNAQGLNVTHNYNIISENPSDTQENFVERVVTILPRLLIFDVKRLAQYEFEKLYDGEKYVLPITRSMIVDNFTIAEGLLSGHRVLSDSGTLESQNANVDTDIYGNEINKILVVGNLVYIEDSNDLANGHVANNYDIHFYQNINTEADLLHLLEEGENGENYINYIPKAKIRRVTFSLSLSTNERITKYYDTLPFDLEIECIWNEQAQMHTFHHKSGKIINTNLEDLLTLRGLVRGESIEFRLFTEKSIEDGSVAWFWDESNVILRRESVITRPNYNIMFSPTNTAYILPRQICIDVNNMYPEGIDHIYNGDTFRIDVSEGMVVGGADDSHYLENYTDCLGLIDGHRIVAGSRKTYGSNVGEQDLVPDVSIVILDIDDIDVTSNYNIHEAANQIVNIVRAELIIDANAADIEKTKVYDGKVFEIPLSAEIIEGLVLNHYIAKGKIVTLNSQAGVGKETICSEYDIEIIEPSLSGVDRNVTNNYRFVFIPIFLDILPKEIRIQAREEYYKTYNENTEVILQEKHYQFREDDIYSGDVVRLISYNAAFSSDAPDTSETITVTNLIIDNQNYILINQIFTIEGHIIKRLPKVEIEQGYTITQINEKEGVIFQYDAVERKVDIRVLGLDDENVRHKITYWDMQNNKLPGPPINAGLYEMQIEQDDPNYAYWDGETIMIRIEPSEVRVSFSGSFTQVYGDVVNIRARIIGGGNLNLPVDPACIPTGPGYTYPEAGEYELNVEYNLDNNFVNYTSIAERRVLVINKKDITIKYSGYENLVYNGQRREIPVSIASGIVSADIGVVTDDKLVLEYNKEARNAGDYVLNVYINNHNYKITNAYLEFEIKKKDLTVRALLNDTSRATVYEGDVVIEHIAYEGFVEGEVRASLTRPAYLPHIPKTIINDFVVTPFGAESPNYNFIYVTAYITILEKKITHIEDEDGLAILMGEFGSFAKVKVKAIETSIINPDFFLINEKIERHFASTDLLDKYSPKMAYNLAIIDDEDTSKKTSFIRLKLSPELLKDDNFLVAHFSANGDYEIIGAYRDGGYIVFNADDLGDFVIFSSRGSLSTTKLMLIFFVPIIVFMLGLFFYVLFRRKYDAD